MIYMFVKKYFWFIVFFLVIIGVSYFIVKSRESFKPTFKIMQSSRSIVDPTFHGRNKSIIDPLFHTGSKSIVDPTF